MSKVLIEIDVPKGINSKELEAKFVKAAAQIITEQTVLRLYESNEISTETGAHLLGMSVHDFVLFLGRHHVSIFNYGEGELEAELNRARGDDPMIVVSNTTPLIALAAINSLDLLSTLYTTLHIPEAVYHEVVTSSAGRAGGTSVATAGWIARHSVADKSAVSDFKTKYRLDTGESEAIVLAAELNANVLLVDDYAARRIAQQLNLPIIGTVGILLRAKDMQLISTVKPSLDALLQAGIYIDAVLYQRVLQLAGE